MKYEKVRGVGCRVVRDAGDRDAKNAVLTDKNPYRDVLVSVLEWKAARAAWKLLFQSTSKKGEY